MAANFRRKRITRESQRLKQTQNRNRPAVDGRPWEVEFNFAPKILPEDFRKTLGPYFAGGKPPGRLKWTRQPAMTVAQVVECGRKAGTALKALFEEAYLCGNKLAAILLTNNLLAGVAKLQTLANERPKLLALLTPRMPRFPLNCSRSRRVREANDELLKRLNVGESSLKSKPPKGDSPLQVFADDLLTQMGCALAEFFLRYPDEKTRQEVLANCDEIERRLIALPILNASSVTGQKLRDWFDVAWSILKRQTRDHPETLPRLKATWDHILRARGKEEEKYYRKRHPSKSNSKKSVGYRRARLRARRTVETNLRYRLRQRVAEAFFALFDLRYTATRQNDSANPQ